MAPRLRVLTRPVVLRCTARGYKQYLAQRQKLVESGLSRAAVDAIIEQVEDITRAADILNKLEKLDAKMDRMEVNVGKEFVSLRADVNKLDAKMDRMEVNVGKEFANVGKEFANVGKEIVSLRAAVNELSLRMDRGLRWVPAWRAALQLLDVRGRKSVIRMVKTQSADLGVGVEAPPFTLTEPLTGKKVSMSDFIGSPTLLMFICNHCPFVVHLKPAIVALTAEYASKGVKSVAISSNSPITHPQDGPEAMAEEAKTLGYGFPYLFDESQEVAKAYNAACTPEFYVFDAQHRLAYHGQFDDSRPRTANPLPVTGKDLRAALDAVLAGKPAPASKPSIGCNIKWAPGNEPSYFGAQVVKATA